MEVGAGPRVEFILQPAEDCRMFLLAALYNYEITVGQDGGNNLVVSCLVSVTWNIAGTLTLTLTPGTASAQLPTINTSPAEPTDPTIYHTPHLLLNCTNQTICQADHHPGLQLTDGMPLCERDALVQEN